MIRRHPFLVAFAVVFTIVLGWGVIWAVDYLVAPRVTTPEPAAPETAATDVAHITAMLYYANAEGTALVPVQREVQLAEGTVAQGRQILLAQLEAAPEPYVSVIPPGTTLRAFYVTSRGDAFVDLSREAAANHPGGSFTELMTVHAIVNAVTANLPAIQRVQILVDGKETDTLAGHVDLRRPLARDDSLVATNEVQ